MVPTLEDGSDLSSDLKKKGRNQRFGKILRSKRLEKGLTQKELAGILHVNKFTIQRYEDGEIPKVEFLLSFSEMFGCSIDWLLKGMSRHTILPSKPQNNDTQENPITHPQNNVIESKHADVVRRFIDKSYAMDLNLSLVELERLSPEAYRKVGSYIKGVVDGVRMMTSGNLTGTGSRTEGNCRQVCEENIDNNPDQYIAEDVRKAG